MKKLILNIISLILFINLLGIKDESWAADTRVAMIPKLEPNFEAVEKIWSLPVNERAGALFQYIGPIQKQLKIGKGIAYLLPVLDKGLIDSNSDIRWFALARFLPSIRFGEDPAIFNQDKNRENIIRSLMHDESVKTREYAMFVLLYYFPVDKETFLEALNVQDKEIKPETRRVMLANFDRLYDFAPKEIRQAYINEIMEQRDNDHLDRAASWAAKVIGRRNPPSEVMDMIASKSYGDRFNEKIAQSFIDYGKDSKNPRWPVQKYMRTLQRMRNSILLGSYSTRHMSENDFKREKKYYIRPIDLAIEKIEAME